MIQILTPLFQFPAVSLKNLHLQKKLLWHTS